MPRSTYDRVYTDLRGKGFSHNAAIDLMTIVADTAQTAAKYAKARQPQRYSRPRPTPSPAPAQSPGPQRMAQQLAPHVIKGAQALCYAREAAGKPRPTFAEAVEEVQAAAKAENCDLLPRSESDAIERAEAYCKSCQARGAHMSFAHAVRLAKAGAI